MASYSVYMGLGGRARQLLVTANNNVSVWPLAEMQKTEARDIFLGMNPGTWTNTSGFTRGVSIDTPEGALGATFDGTAYIAIADDGQGFEYQGSTRNLSLAQGSFTIAFYIKTSTNNATLRAIWQKTETNSSGNGIYVALQSGAIVFSFKKAGVSVFNFSRGSIADGVGRWVVCTANAATGVASIYIAGALSGATQSFTAGTEPAFTTGPARIGMFTDGVGGFIGTLGYVALSRNVDTALGGLLHASLSWTDVSADVIADSLEFDEGIMSSAVKDRQAGVGTCALALFNTPKVSGTVTPGRYTYGHANCRTGFAPGIPIKVVRGSTVEWRGWIREINPDPGSKGPRRVHVVAEDWFGIAAATIIADLPLYETIRSDQAWAAVVDEADQPPCSVSMTAGSEIFPYFGDQVRDGATALEELTKIVVSEWGFSYPRPSTTGGLIVFEPRSARQLDTTFDATFDGTMGEMSVEVGTRAIYNIGRGTVTPRELGATDTDVLYASVSRQLVPPLESITVEGSYQDPAQSRSVVGGTDFQPFTSGTDYTLTEFDDGSGEDRTAQLDVLADIGGSGYAITFRNTSSSKSGYVGFQVRGRLLISDVPITVPYEDGDSIRAYQASVFDETFPYMNSADSARSILELVVNTFKTPMTFTPSVDFRPRQSSALETTVLARACGDLVGLGDALANVSTTTKVWIQGRRVRVRQNGLATVSWRVFPSFPAASSTPFGAWDAGTWDGCLWAV